MRGSVGWTFNSTEVGWECQIKYKWNIQHAAGKTMNALKDWLKWSLLKYTLWGVFEAFPYYACKKKGQLYICVGVSVLLLCCSFAFFFPLPSPMHNVQCTCTLIAHTHRHRQQSLYDFSRCALLVLSVSWLAGDATVSCRSQGPITNLLLTLSKCM